MDVLDVCARFGGVVSRQLASQCVIVVDQAEKDKLSQTVFEKFSKREGIR